MGVGLSSWGLKQQEDDLSGYNHGFARRSPGDPAFRVEQHGIDFIPESERWATPRNIGAMWAGSAINVEYFIYGALLMGSASASRRLSIIILGNLSFLLLGLASLQGPEAGTTAFAISRRSFGTHGSRS